MVTDLYEIPMTGLNFYNHDGSCPTENGIDSFYYNGQTFKCDDLVVVDGQIGNIELVNTEAGVCGLGMSLVYADVMARKPWSMSSGHRCPMDGLRHAMDKEKKLFDRDAEEVYDIAEASDRAWKERFEVNW